VRNIEIRVFQIGQTQMNEDGVRQWLDHVGAPGCPVPEEMPTEGIPGLAAKRCYMSFEAGLNPNVTRVRKDWHDFFENILNSGHGSVLEHASVTVAIEGVSRVFTGEMNRHRAGVAISEGSMRYIRFDDIPWWLPLSLRPGCDMLDDDSGELDRRQAETRNAFDAVFEYVQQTYTRLVDLWKLDESTDFGYKKKVTSMLRRIIPMGIATGGVWTMNFRALRHMITMRSDPAAEEEIAYVFGIIAKMMIEQFPNILCDFTQDADGFWRPHYRKV